MTSDLQCLRCRYQWKRRTWNRLPRQCPNCHRNDWNKPEVGRVGRPPLKLKTVESNPEKTMPASDKPVEVEQHCLCEFAIPDWDRVTHDPRCHRAQKAKEGAMPASAKATQDASTDEFHARLAKTMRENVKPVEPAMKDKAQNVGHVLTLDEMASLPQDAPTDDLLNHLLEQMEKDEAK